MNWKKAFGYGALIWVVIYAVASALVKAPEAAMTAAIFVFDVGLAWYLAGKVELRSVSIAAAYGAVWAAVGIVLDLLVTRQFVPDLFSSWLYWVSYALIIITPVARKSAKRRPTVV